VKIYLAFELPTLPKGGRIDKYQEEFKILLEKSSSSNFSELEQFETFILRIFKDCKVYLSKKLGASFPDILLTFFYNKDEYSKRLSDLDMFFGQSRPYTNTITFNLGTGVNIYINIQDHLEGDLIVNLCSSFIEELIHIIDPTKSETQIHNTVCFMLEGFLEMKLSESIKNERLRYSKECDETD